MTYNRKLELLDEAHDEMIKSLFKTPYRSGWEGTKLEEAIKNMQHGLSLYDAVYRKIAKLLQEQSNG